MEVDMGGLSSVHAKLLLCFDRGEEARVVDVVARFPHHSACMSYGG